MKNFNPKRWSIVCWVLVALWAFIGFGNNVAYAVHNLPDEILTTLPDGRRAAVYDIYSEFGFPFAFQKQWTPAKTTKTNISFYPHWLAVNLILVTLAIAGVVVTVQTWWLRFTIKGFMLSIVVISCVFALGSNLAPFLQDIILYLVYFCPVITAALIFRSNLPSMQPIAR